MSTYTINVPVTDIFGSPNDHHVISNFDSQALYGETFISEREQDGFIFGKLETDAYEGWIKAKHLEKKEEPATHIITHPSTNIYSEPNDKTRPESLIYAGAKVVCVPDISENGFIRIVSGAWIFANHLSPLPLKNTGNFVDTAKQFMKAPYLYGGRSIHGIDCSGLVQLSLLLNGISAPRDSIDQEKSLGQNVPYEDLKRGDLVFFKGHVGIMVDKLRIVNATARSMDVCIETLTTLDRIYGGITSIKRINL